MPKKKQTYASAMQELEQIQQALEAGTIGVDELSETLKRAKELMVFCRDKLRAVEEETGGLQF